MRTVTKEWLENGDDHAFYTIGSDEERANYYPAIIGMARDMSHVVYSLEKLAECFMKVNNWTWDEAIEWIEYDVERALPYYGKHAPVILMNKFIHKDNKYYEPIRVKC